MYVQASFPLLFYFYKKDLNPVKNLIKYLITKGGLPGEGEKLK